MKRRELERGKEEREDADIHAKKAEADRLYQLYQAEKTKQRQRNAHAVSDFHLKQAVSFHDPSSAVAEREVGRRTIVSFFSLPFCFCSKNERIADRNSFPPSWKNCSTNDI